MFVGAGTGALVGNVSGIDSKLFVGVATGCEGAAAVYSWRLHLFLLHLFFELRSAAGLMQPAFQMAEKQGQRKKNHRGVFCDFGQRIARTGTK